MKIVYQGSPGAYSHLAAKKMYPDYEPISQNTFEECFNLCLKNESYRTIIPVENSIAGRVADIHNLLPRTKLIITGEYFLKINHQLLGAKETNIKSIKFAISHFHALAQCRDFLQKNKIKPILGTDTAGAAEDLSKKVKKDTAAIASSLAAEIYNLKILKKNIQDAHHNTTRFFIMRDKLEEKRIEKEKQEEKEDLRKNNQEVYGFNDKAQSYKLRKSTLGVNIKIDEDNAFMYEGRKEGEADKDWVAEEEKEIKEGRKTPRDWK